MSPRPLWALVLAVISFPVWSQSGSLSDWTGAESWTIRRDSELLARWPLDDEPALPRLFQSDRELKLGERGGVRLATHESGMSRAVVRELVLTAPFDLRVEVALDAGASAGLELVDVENEAVRSFVLLNARVFGDRRRYDAIVELEHGQSKLGSDAQKSRPTPDRFVSLQFLGTRDEARFLVDGRLIDAAVRLPMNKFSVALLAREGGARFRNLSIAAQLPEGAAKRFEHAVQIASQPTRSNPRSPKREVIWSLLARELGQSSLPEHRWGETKALTGSAKVAFDRGFSALLNGDAEVAHEKFRLAHSLHPRSVVLGYLAASSAQSLGQSAEAERGLAAVVALDPSFVEAWRELALARFAQADPDGAAAALEGAERADPTDPWLWVIRAHFATERGDALAARAAAARARELHPDSEALALLDQECASHFAAPRFGHAFLSANSEATVHSGGSLAEADAVADQAARFLQFLQQCWPGPKPPGASITIFVFPSEIALRDFVVDQGSREPGARALYHEGLRAILIANGPTPELFAHNLRHELTHAHFARQWLHTPAWLAEGLAELAATLIEGSSEGGAITNPVVPGDSPRVAALLSACESGSVVPLATLLRMDRETFLEPEGAALHYAQSYGFIRWLLTEAPESARKTYLDQWTALASGATIAASHDQSWGRLDPIGWAQMEIDFYEAVAKWRRPSELARPR